MARPLVPDDLWLILEPLLALSALDAGIAAWIEENG
jgi:hypothetical protein